ncbi:MAG: DUF5671 domain-containing protein [Nocardioidaceae bacterium]
MLIIALFLVLVAALVVVAARRVMRRDAETSADGRALRRTFQYLLLLGLLAVVGAGLTGLLGRLFEPRVLVARDEAALARDLAFVVVGAPILVALVMWTRQLLARDAEEARSLGWAGYVSVAGLVTLVVAMTSLHRVLTWVAGLGEYDGGAIAGTLVWGALWGAHWWADTRVTPPDHRRVHHVLGSVAGLAVAATGLAGVLAAGLRILLGIDGGAALAGGDRPMLRGLVTVAVGAPVWLVYWVRSLARSGRDPLWVGYVLLVGAGGGLLVAVVAASTVGYSVLVWLLGDPGSGSAGDHFSSAPGTTAAAVVGAAVWWYHRTVLAGDAEVRSEVHRIYDYVMAAIGLLAAAAGLVTLLAALVEALAGAAFVGGAAVNTLLAALTLLAVGGPVWWVQWRRTQRAAALDPAGELRSPTRRGYLLVLFGIGVLVTVGALIAGVYLLFQDVVTGTVSAETLRRMRFPIGLVLATAGLAAYHWGVYRRDRQGDPRPAAPRGPGFLLLVGAPDDGIVAALARETGGHVLSWSRTDLEPRAWSVPEVLAALDGLPDVGSQEIVVVAEVGGVRAIPVRRASVVRRG